MKRGLFLIILTVTTFAAFSQNIDINLLTSINLDRNKQLDGTFEAITNSITPFTIAVPVGFITYAVIRKDSTHTSNAIFVCTTLIVSGVMTTAMKYTFNRDRPFETYPYVQHLVPGSGPSFPSGHTSTAFAIATSVSMIYPKWYVITGSFLWASAVGYSRMDLGVHYPSDVLMGAVVGSGSAFLSKKLTQWINKKSRKSARPA